MKFFISIVLGMFLSVVHSANGIPVVASDVKQEVLTQHLWIPGTVISRFHANIAAEVSGRILWVEEVGNPVVKGATMAGIDDSVIDLDIKELQAEIGRMSARINYLQRKVQRLRKMDQNKNVSREILEESEMDLAVTRQELQKVRINLERKQLYKSKSRLQAPFSGVVVERLVQQGEYVHEGEEVLKLVDVESREIKANVPMSAVEYLTPGQTITLRYDSEQQTGRLRVVLPVGDEVTHTVEIRVELDGSKWLPGTPVRVQVPTSDERKRLLVPRDALVLRGKEAFVYAIDGEGKSVRKKVEIGEGSGEHVSVRGDLKKGEQVIVRGAERIQSGQKVQLLDNGS